MYNMVIICGKSGSGKDSIVKELVKREPNLFHQNISMTTRPKREGEIEGKDYTFVSEELIMKLMLSGNMLDVTQFNGWFYGTSLISLSRDKINISIYNPEGIDILLENNEVNPLIFYIDCKDRTRLLRSLNREVDLDVKEMIRRYGTDDKDFNDLFKSDVEYITLVNETRGDYENIIQYIIEKSKDFFK